MDNQQISYDENDKQRYLSPIPLNYNNYYFQTSENNENDNHQHQFHNIIESLDNFDQISDSEDSLHESRYYVQKEKSPYNSEENVSKKPTSATKEKTNNNPLNNNVISEKKINEILNNVSNSENSQNSNQFNQKNNSEISLENFPSNSYNKIIEFYGDNLKKSKEILTGEGNNTKRIENKLNKTEKSNYSEEKEKDKNLGKKRKKKNEINEEKKETKQGRKKKDDDPGEHTKMKEDNLMFKIKSSFNNWTLNDLINQFLPEKKKLMKIDFKDFSKNINTKENIGFLQMELGEIFSQNISPIYSKKIMEKDGYNYNKNIIDEIMKSDLENAKAILKIKYKDALDLYRYKENETNLKKILDAEIINKIEGRVDEFLFKTFEDEKEKIGVNEADDFVSSLLVMVYNYERWFLLKKPRQKKKKTIEIEIKDGEE